MLQSFNSLRPSDAYICVSKLTNFGSDNGLSPGRRQAIIWTYAGILLIGPLGTNFSGISIEVYTFSFKKMHLKMSSGKCRPFCLGLNVLTQYGLVQPYGIIYLTQHWFRHQAISCTNVALLSVGPIGKKNLDEIRFIFQKFSLKMHLKKKNYLQNMIFMPQCVNSLRRGHVALVVLLLLVIIFFLMLESLFPEVSELIHVISPHLHQWA